MELLINLVGVFVGLATLAGGVFAYVKGLGKRDQQIKDLADDVADTRKDLEKLEGRVGKVEETATNLSKLPEAIEHMGEKFAVEFRRLGDIWELDRSHTRGVLAQIQDQLNRKVGE